MLRISQVGISQEAMQIGSRLLNLNTLAAERTASSEIHIKGKKRGAAMPKPGSRQYDCVKRAWHSDRHKPLRGIIIQHIFRLVREAHCEKTKNNREWQEKLPVVVFKCEEILYSKANNESEYLDQDTLWDRVSDAVNAVIRLEDVNEDGKNMLPCVEAALTLGSVPVKASRSQRHCNHQTYLRPIPQDPNVLPQRNINNAITQQCPRLGPVGLSFLTPDRKMVQNKDIMNEPSSFTLPHKTFHSGGAHQSTIKESNSSSSVYPLYYGTEYQLRDPLESTNQRKCIQDASQEILIGRPVTRFLPNSARMTTKKYITPKATRQTVAHPCDLSLRLGVSSSLDAYEEKNCQLDFSSSRWNSEDMGLVGESSILNNLASFHDFMEVGPFF